MIEEPQQIHPSLIDGESTWESRPRLAWETSFEARTEVLDAPPTDVASKINKTPGLIHSLWNFRGAQQPTDIYRALIGRGLLIEEKYILDYRNQKPLVIRYLQVDVLPGL